LETVFYYENNSMEFRSKTTGSQMSLDYQRDLKLIRNRTMIDFDSMGINNQLKASIRLMSRSLVMERFRTQSEMSEITSETRAEIRVPVLGPTRQQTDMFLYHSARQKLEKLQRLR
jgi:hypothetical protein